MQSGIILRALQKLNENYSIGNAFTVNEGMSAGWEKIKVEHGVYLNNKPTRYGFNKSGDTYALVGDFISDRGLEKNFSRAVLDVKVSEAAEREGWYLAGEHKINENEVIMTFEVA